MYAGITKTICITSKRKEALITYLTYKDEDNTIPLNNAEKNRLSSLNELNTAMSYFFTVQKKPHGVGNALLLAEKYIKNDSFFCMAYPDDIITDYSSGMNELMHIHKLHNCSVISIQEVPFNQVHSYGIIDATPIEKKNRLFNIKAIIEKPSIDKAPSCNAIVGRYILDKKILSLIKKNPNNCFITALNTFLEQGNKVIGVALTSPRYDIGTIEGWLHAIHSINKTEERIPHSQKTSLHNISIA